MWLLEWKSRNPPALLGHLSGQRQERLSLSQVYNCTSAASRGLQGVVTLFRSQTTERHLKAVPLSPPAAAASKHTQWVDFHHFTDSSAQIDTHCSNRPSSGSGDQLETVWANTWSHLTWWRKTEQETSAGSETRRIISDICWPKSERPRVVAFKSVLKGPAAGWAWSWISTLAKSELEWFIMKTLKQILSAKCTVIIKWLLAGA